MNTLSSVGKGYQDSITRKQRCGMLEILFESYHAPSLPFTDTHDSILCTWKTNIAG